MATLTELVELTRQLVGFNTVSVAGRSGPARTQSTREMGDFVSNQLESAGFKVQQYPYTTDGIEKMNLVATKGGEEPFLALSGHMDVVPVGDWKPGYEPFALKFGPYEDKKTKARYDCFYGRGSADMKLFLAIIMLVGGRIDASTLRRPLGIYLTSDEEVGCLGVKLLFQEQARGLKAHTEFKVKTHEYPRVVVPQHVLIGEPTELKPVYMHKGYMFLTVEIKSTDKEAGHSSDPTSGHSAIKTGLPEVLLALNRLEVDLQAITDKRFKVPYPTLNPGVITMDAGAAKNILATGCTIDLEVRLLPGQEVDVLFGVVKETVERAVGELEGITARVLYRRSPTLPMETAQNSPLVQVLEDMTGQAAGTENYNTEGGTYNRHGAAGVLCGPGSIKQAHKPDEHVAVKYFDSGIVDFYAEVVRRLCCVERR